MVSVTTASSSSNLLETGAKYHREGKIDAAYMHYLAALTFDPEDKLAWQNLSAALLAMDMFPAAKVAAQKALRLDSANPHALSNLGVAEMGLRNFSAAEHAFRYASGKLGESAPIWHNLGLSLYMRQEFGCAIMAFQKSLSLSTERQLQVESDLGLALLAAGKIKEGLEVYEARWHGLHKSKIWSLGLPEWKGENLAGKKILLHHEQGFGDSLMLSRFVHSFLSAGADVTLAVPGELVKLFSRSFKEVSVVDWDSEIDINYIDYHSPLLSAWRWLSAEVPAFVPYLFSNIEKKAHANGKFRVGLCWASGDHGRVLARRRRHVSLGDLLPLSLIRNVELISLQKGKGEEEIDTCGAHGFIKNEIATSQDFADTAAIIENLDLVISVDSAVAHLAGAMGKPVIMLGPSPRCWRWWNVDNGGPWYSDFTILTQEPNGSWNKALSELNELVYKFVKKATK